MLKFPTPHERTLPHKIKINYPQHLQADNNTLDKVTGSLLGLAIGDALGASVEFRPRDYLRHHPVTDMQKGGTWGLNAGQWTDDTSMALCLASSLITKRGFDPYDQMVRYKWWFKHGFLSSTGRCFDIGTATRRALDEFSRRQKFLKDVYKCRTEDDVDRVPLEKVIAVKEFSLCCSSPGVAGNGALMRLAPVPLFFFRSPKEAIEYAGKSAELTHGDKIAHDACRYYAALIVAAVQGESKENLLSNNFYNEHMEWFGTTDLHPEVLSVAQGSYKRPGGYDDGIRGKGYIVNALEAALWAFHYDNNSFANGVLATIHLGDDTDTTAAIYGQLAGAFYGSSNLPEKWKKQLYAEKLITCIAHWLNYLGEQQSSTQNQTQKVDELQEPSIINPSEKLKLLGATKSLPNETTKRKVPTDMLGYDSRTKPFGWSYTASNQSVIRSSKPLPAANISHTVQNIGAGASHSKLNLITGRFVNSKTVKPTGQYKPPNRPHQT